MLDPKFNQILGHLYSHGCKELSEVDILLEYVPDDDVDYLRNKSTDNDLFIRIDILRSD